MSTVGAGGINGPFENAEVTVSEAIPLRLSLESTPSGIEVAPEVIEAINDSISIKTYGAVHSGSSDRFATLKAVDIEYEAAAGVVDGLDPARGDKLFIENFDFKGDKDGRPAELHMALLGQGTVEQQLHTLEELRASRSIHAFQYASFLATIKGIPVVSADMSAAGVSEFAARTGYAPNDADAGSGRPEVAQLHAERERDAVQVVLAAASADLPYVGANHPTYAVLWGGAHFGDRNLPNTQTLGITHEFGQLGLRTEHQMLPHALRERELRRIGELISYLPRMSGAPESLRQEALQAGYEPHLQPMLHPTAIRALAWIAGMGSRPQS